jgi:hypothetical protein
MWQFADVSCSRAPPGLLQAAAVVAKAPRMRLARLRVAAGQRLCTQACGGHAAAAPRLLPHACRGRLIARPCSAAADVERSAAPETPAASGYCAACAKTHSLPRTREADAAAEALLARIRASGRLDFDADVAVRYSCCCACVRKAHC